MNARRLAARAKHFPRDASRWLSIVRSTPAADEVRVYYGRDRVPLRDELTHGGAIKLQTLTDAFPNAPRDRRSELGDSQIGNDYVAATEKRILHLVAARLWKVELHQRAGIEVDGATRDLHALARL